MVENSNRGFDEVLKEAIRKKAEEDDTTEDVVIRDLEETFGSNVVKTWLGSGEVGINIVRRKTAVKIASFALQMSPEDTILFLNDCGYKVLIASDIWDETMKHLKDFPIRRFDEVLKEAIRKKVVDHNVKITKITENDVIRDLYKTFGVNEVGGWLKQKKQGINIDRKTVIKIAFALEMGEEDADLFLKRCWHNGFYMRDFKDLIYSYGLDMYMSFDETEQLISQKILQTVKESAGKIASDLGMTPGDTSFFIDACQREALEEAGITSIKSAAPRSYQKKKGILPVRRFDDVLKEAIKKKIKKDNISEDDVKHNLRKAFNKKVLEKWLLSEMPVERKTAIKIALALQMTPQEADLFLKNCQHHGLNKYDYKDLVYWYCLDKKFGYKKAEQITIDDLTLPNPEPVINAKWEKVIKENKVTDYLKKTFEESVFSVKDMDEYFQEHKELFGTFRRKSHELFKKYINKIEEQATYNKAREVKENKRALEELRYGKDKIKIYRVIYPNYIDSESVAGKKYEERIKLKNSILWLINLEALVFDGKSEDEIRELAEARILKGKSKREVQELNEGLNILLNPDLYKSNILLEETLEEQEKNLEKQKENLAALEKNLGCLFNPNMCSPNIILSELVKDTNKYIRLLFFKAYARTTVSDEALHLSLMMGIPDLVLKRNARNASIVDKIYKGMPRRREALSEIINKSIRDGRIARVVDRKLLIIAWLKLGGDDEMNKEGNESSAFRQDILKLNDVLKRCGMPKLDHRHPFDSIVIISLYCSHMSTKTEETPDTVEMLRDIIVELGKWS